MSDRPAVKPPHLARDLKFGDRGDDVKRVQTILQKEGFFQGTPLGNFLALTQEAVMYFQNTHIDEEGKELVVDGKVGPKTWWALHNPNGDAQRSFIPQPETPAVDPGEREKFLRTLYAMHKQGIREIPDGSNYGDGVTPLVNACGFNYGIFWCLAALSAAWHNTFGSAPIGAMHVHCATFWNEALMRGLTRTKQQYTPIPGDIAVYNYAGGLRTNGRLIGAGHVAAVARVSESGAQFNALEGNVGNRFKHSIRNVSERTLVGYVNLFADFKNPPKFERGVTSAPVIAASYSGTR